MRKEVVDGDDYVVHVPDRGGRAGGVGLIAALVIGALASLLQP